MHALKLSIVIPAYNEEKNIAPTVRELCLVLEGEQIPYEILIVNDNSRDNTRAVIAQLQRENPCIRTINRQPPGGFGRAVRDGLAHVEGDVVMPYMADRSDHPQDAVKCYRKIAEGYDCVFGSRFIRGSHVTNYPRLKLVVNRIVNKLIQWAFWTSHNDLTNAFKAYRTYVIRECGPYRACHFNITIELSLSALIRNYDIAIVPIDWQGREWGSSNLRLREMGRRYLSTLLQVFFTKILIRDDILADKLAARPAQTDAMREMVAAIELLDQRVKSLEREQGAVSRSAA